MTLNAYALSERIMLCQEFAFSPGGLSRIQKREPVGSPCKACSLCAVFAHDQRGVSPAKAEAVGQGHVDLALALGIGKDQNRLC